MQNYRLLDAQGESLIHGTWDEVWAYIITTYADMTMQDFAANGYHIQEA